MIGGATAETGAIAIGRASLRRAAVMLLLVSLSLMAGRGSGARVMPGPLVQEGSFVKDNWIFQRQFFYKRDAERNGDGPVAMRANRLAKFANTGEVGYWKVERRAPPGSKRKLPMGGGMDVLVLDVPEQGDNMDLIISYEIPVVKGRYHQTAIRFAGEGNIYVAKSKEELVGPAAAKRKKIGKFSVDIPTLGPIVDRTFTL